MQRADEMKVSIFLICMHPNLKIVNYPFKTYKYGEFYGFTHFLLFLLTAGAQD